MLQKTIVALAAVAAMASVSQPAAAAEDAALKAAVADAARSPANVARDGARHPYETLSFWGLKPKQTVIEVVPGGGYWTEILAPYAKATGGTYVAGVADLANPALSDGVKKARADFEAKFADQGKYGKITYVGFGKDSGPLGAPGSADMVITARNFHNWATAGWVDKAMADFHAVLKPGGVLAVKDHRADPRPEKPGMTDGYVATKTVVAAAEKAGFKLDASSEINANPKDTKDHPFGVWTLPPVRRSSAAAGQAPDPSFDRAKYDAIGESDRMTLRFVKK